MQVGIDNERARSHRLVKVKDGMFSKTAASRLPSFHVIDFPDADNGISRMPVVGIGDGADSCRFEKIDRLRAVLRRFTKE